MGNQYNSTRHAYLIMAHNNFEQLKLLIELLDDPRNDIYLHIDKKVCDKSFKVKTNYSKLIIVNPIRVTWGGHSQIACEMKLFKDAANGHYMYYHLLSGLDLPIKTQDEIHAFFIKHRGCNFIDIDKVAMEKGFFRERTMYYHLFQNMIGRSSSIWARGMRRIENILIHTQKSIHLERKEIIPLWKGANWVSITDELVQYVISCDKLIKRQFYYSLCADEVFLQSIAMYSPYQNTIVNNYCREIDWKRGGPYTFRKEDISMLLDSPALFARKFDEKIDNDIICFLVDYIKRNQCE